MEQKFLEKNLEDIICNSDKSYLYERGLNVQGELFRQYNLGKYGIADIVEFKHIDPYSYIQRHNSVEYVATVYELKRNEIDFNTFAQAIRYVYGLSIKNKIENPSCNFQYRIVLIGSKILNKDELIYMPDLLTPKYLVREDLGKIIDIEFYEYSFIEKEILFERVYGEISNY